MTIWHTFRTISTISSLLMIHCFVCLFLWWAFVRSKRERSRETNCELHFSLHSGKKSKQKIKKNYLLISIEIVVHIDSPSLSIFLYKQNPFKKTKLKTPKAREKLKFFNVSQKRFFHTSTQKILKIDEDDASVSIFWLDFTLTQIFNEIDIQPTYMHKYSSSLSLVPHSLIHMLILKLFRILT